MEKVEAEGGKQLELELCRYCHGCGYRGVVVSMCVYVGVWYGELHTRVSCQDPKQDLDKWVCWQWFMCGFLFCTQLNAGSHDVDYYSCCHGGINSVFLICSFV